MSGISTGPDSDTAVGDIVVINVNCEGPYGVIFESDQDGCAAVIQSWERLPNGKFGDLQKHGGLHHNDVLIAVNDVTLDCVPHREVLRIVNDRNLLKKAFKFMNSADYYRRKKATGGIGLTLQNDGKNSFLSIIRRARISQSSSNKFAEYEIACQWRVASMKVQKEIIYKWSVWKRFSEFTVLHNLLKKSLGWQMQSIEMPSEHTFVINKLSGEFIEQRKEDLNVYWQKIITIDKVVEFSKHHCSQDVKSFLQVDETIRNQTNGTTNTNDDDDNNNVKQDDNNKASRRGSTGAMRAPVRSVASRRRSSINNAGIISGGTDSGSISVPQTQALPTEQPQTNVPTPIPPPPPPPPPPIANKPAPPTSNPVPPISKASALPISESSGPPLPKQTGARMNLLADIAKLRKE